jgi:Tol biopolymer transport system component
MVSSVLSAGLTTVYQQLTAFAGLESFWTNFDSIFGTEYNVSVAQLLRSQWQSGNFSQLPKIEVIDDQVLGNARGAYASSTNVIYLSDQFVETASPQQLEAVVLEEIGHFVDAQVNTTDTVGDEGELFSALVHGVSLSPSELSRIKTENDHTVISLGGQAIAVEQATPIILTVTTTLDENDGSATIGAGLSLRDAILIANANPNTDYEIRLTGGLTYNLTANGINEDAGKTGDLDIASRNNVLYIVSAGTQKATINASNLLNSDRVFDVEGRLSLQNVVVTGGIVSGEDGGGGIYVGLDGLLDLYNTTISNNSSGYRGGGIYNSGTTYLRNGSVISNNSANGAFAGGGGIYNGGRYNGASTLTIIDSTINNNTADDALIYYSKGGGISNESGILVVINSTISNNTAYRGRAGGGGIYIGTSNSLSSSVALVNTTVSGNTSGNSGGGIENYSGVLNVQNSTITNNIVYAGTYGSGGGISGTANLRNTIVAGNFLSASYADDLSGTFNGNGNNLIGSLTGASGTIGTGTDITFASAGITNINQVLDTTLRNNGGLTLTHALVAGSCAINAGNNALIPADTNDMDGDDNTTEQIPFDQRGTSFNRIAGSTVDIGAFEVQGAAIPTVSVNNVSITEGNSGTKNLTFTVALNATSTGTITVDYATANGTAVAGNDYAPINGTLTFTAGQTSKTLTVAIVGDPVLEDNETFLLNLLNPSSNVAITNGVATGTITNDETLNIRRISVSSTGTQGNDNSYTGYTPSISADGRYIAFSSNADNLVSGDTNYYADIFVYDRQTSQTTRVSVSSSGTQGNYDSSSPSISADGRYVTFESGDIFVHDRQTSQTSRVSVSSSGTEANSYSSNPSISADGRYVTFASYADNLVAGDTNYSADIFVYDRQTGQTSRVSVSSSGTQGNYDSSSPSISADGRYVTFQSDASNLVAGDTTASDIFVYDRQTSQTSRVSVSSSGTEANYNSSSPSISADGRYVTFQSGADNLVAGDTNGYADVFVYDRQLGQTTRISASASNVQGDYSSNNPTISSDGRYVAFQSEASNLVAGDTNGVQDVFVYDSGINATVPSVTLTLSPSAVSEDGSTNLVYTFTRLGLSTSPLTVNYTVGGTATFNTDYSQTGAATFTATTGTITFAAGSSLATLTINPTADTTPEANETVALTLTAGTGYSVSTPSAVTGTINDDDNKITLTVSPTSVNEDGATNLVYTFNPHQWYF